MGVLEILCAHALKCVSVTAAFIFNNLLGTPFGIRQQAHPKNMSDICRNQKRCVSVYDLLVRQHFGQNEAKLSQKLFAFVRKFVENE